MRFHYVYKFKTFYMYDVKVRLGICVNYVYVLWFAPTITSHLSILIIITTECSLRCYVLHIYMCNELWGRPAPAVFRRDRRRLIRFTPRTTDTLR